MTLTTVSTGAGRCSVGESDLWIRPSRNYRPGVKRAAVYFHQGQANGLTPQDWSENPGTASLMHAIASAGYVVGSSDLGGPSTLGNAIGVSRAATLTAWARTTGVSAPSASTSLPIVAVGISGGFSSLVNHFSTSPSNVAAIIGILPAWDLIKNYNENSGGIRTAIEIAHGIVHPEAFPTISDPRTNTPPLSGIPTRLYYATDDPIFDASLVSLADVAFGANCESISVGALGHTDAAISAIDKPNLVEWLRTIAPSSV